MLYVDTWNDSAVKAAWDENTPAQVKPLAVYAASKTEGERAAWKWVEENKPHFVFNSVLPNMNVRKASRVELTSSPTISPHQLISFISFEFN